MKTTFVAALAACVALAAAQDDTPYYNISSKPFHLVLETAQNDTLNGATLFSCHEGAGIEGLCLGNKNLTGADVYNFNTSIYQQPSNRSIGDPGILSWILPTVGASFPSALTLQANPTSNMGMPLFFPGDTNAQSLAFDDNDALNIQGFADDSVFPVDTSEVKAYYRWYICVTYYGYTYTTLSWKYGNGDPQNPTCQEVNVKRVWAE